jgi:aminocarboxymuconate-semialdehyde decarboxylase
MIVDIYSHLFPRRFIDAMTEAVPTLGGITRRLLQVTKIHDLDARFREMDEYGDYRQIVSLPNPPLEDLGPPEIGTKLAKIANDMLADICGRHPDRFPAWVAAVCLTDVDAALAEIERAVDGLGARGILIYTTVAGRPLDDPRFEPVFAAMAARDLPIWLHPCRTAATVPDFPSEAKSRYELWWCLGWPYETSITMIRLAFSGLFDRHPGLKIVTHHLGGMIPYYDGRVGAGLDLLGSRTPDEDYSGVLPALKRPHMDYLRGFFADTAMFGAANGLRCGFDFFGADQVVFATDAPLGPIGKQIEAVKGLGLSAADAGKVFCGNAERLLNMKLS